MGILHRGLGPKNVKKSDLENPVPIACEKVRCTMGENIPFQPSVAINSYDSMSVKVQRFQRDFLLSLLRRWNVAPEDEPKGKA